MNNSFYWNKYYDNSKRSQSIPSQFATFIAGEANAENIGVIVDLGCGTGRDSTFFASLGFNVVGVDASESAISHCNTITKELSTSFILSDIGDSGLISKLQARIPPDKVALIYSRFFLHAIDDAAEDALLTLVSSLANNQLIFALEFRTIRDQQQTKVTENHYRRYIHPASFLNKAASLGFSVDYFVEGFGFAKFGKDDAHVARVILRKT